MRTLSFVICAAYAMLLLCFDVGDLQAADPAKVRVGYINNTQSAVLVEMKALAKEKSRYRPHPVHALSRRAEGSRRQQRGRGHGVPNGPPTAVAQGDRNVIAVMDLAYGGDSLVVRKGVSVQKFQDLKGKRIGLAEGGIAWMMFVMLLDKNGVDANDIQAVNFGAATDLVNALKRGDVDAVDVWEPFLTQTIAEGYGDATSAVDYSETCPGIDEQRSRSR